MYQPHFEITPELLIFVTRATEIRTWIREAVIDVTWLPALQRETAAKLAHSSTSIEGNPLTLPEVEALARGEVTGTPDRHKREVLNYLAAMKWVWNRKTGEMLQEADLLGLHKILTHQLLPDEQIGQYKKKPNRVIDPKGHTVYTPPSPSEARPLTLDLISWINSPKIDRLHPILSSAVAHHRLVSIHPFTDGNGRIARSLGIWLLYTRGFDTHHLFALDEYFEGDRQLYYDKIQQARDLDDNLTYWLEYVAKAIVETLHSTKERILSLKLSSKTPKIALSKRQEDFLRFIRDKERVKSPDLEKAFKMTRSRVNQIIKPLVEAGVVLQEGNTRATTYRIAS